MRRLSSPIRNIKPHYDVIVVGSGYGGAIAASRLSRAGMTVCVLERGKERQAGEYPSNTLEAAAELQLDLPESHRGSRTGLFDMHVNPDISVLVGCGLGGTSLINANVSIRPDPRVFEDPRWPEALRREHGERIALGFRLAEEMLGANPYPASLPTPPKLAALESSAKAMGRKFERLKLNVTFTAGVNHAGVEQSACKLCGDCASGCNHGAKNTVLMNYLPDAKRHGAEIFVETSVRWVERGADNRWSVHYQLLNERRELFHGETLFVTGDIVVLAAGSLGSTEILMRSRDAGKLGVSDRLGEGFSGNGDMLGFGYNTTHEIRSVGLGEKAPADGQPLDDKRVVGPCITGVIDMRGGADYREDMIIEEGAIPAAIAPMLPAIQRTAGATCGVNTALGKVIDQQMREADSAVLGPYRGATAHTQTYLGMCHDGSNGAMKLEDDRLRIAWPSIGKAPIFEALNQRLLEATRHLDGVYIANPVWSNVLGKSLITVHPLGGCNMADAAEGGVVNHACKVFSSSSGAAAHEGLYVCDGSIVPTSLGVNPLLTISALTERCCMIIAEERGHKIDYASKGPIDTSTQDTTIGIRLSESMKGWFSPAKDDDYVAAARRGEAEGSSLQFILTIAADSADEMISSPNHQGTLVGTVTAPRLSPRPLMISQGVFNLFVEDPTRPGVRLMKYQMRLLSEEGRAYHFKGFKVIRDAPIWDLWKDNTTLYITVHEGPDESGPVAGIGVLKILPDDFIRLLATIDATNTRNQAERVAATARFGRYFAGTLYDKYGAIVSKPTFGRLASAAAALSFDEEDATPRKRRPLRASAPDFVPIKASDGTDLLLTRFAGGQKGPVILAHGLGASSGIFSVDTIDTNLLEYLFAKGYDVWLFDHRGSALLPGERPPHSADDVAQKDWPAAVAAVQAATGAASVQVVAHELGAAMFSMAMLSGLSGVRAAVCSQLATHLVMPKASVLSAGLYAPELPAALGFGSLAAAAGSAEDWVSPLYDRALGLALAGGAEMCDSELCREICFMYGARYEHAQLDEATHAAVSELFGRTGVKLLESLSVMAREGRVVNAAGEDSYLPHLDRMAIAIRFIHGAENKAFLPESTEKAAKALGARNGAALYSRLVIAGYGQDDCIFGKSAAIDVYPHILEHLEAT